MSICDSRCHCRRKRPVQNEYVHRATPAVKPKQSRSVTNTLKESNRAPAVKPKQSSSITNTLKENNSRSTCTARENEQRHYRDCSRTLPPRVPPRTHSLPRSLNKIDELENLQLQDLSNQALRDQNPRVDTHRVDSENAYQPLILPWSSKNTISP